MSTPFSATIARLKPQRDKPLGSLSRISVLTSVGSPVRNGLLTRAVLVIVFIPFVAKASFVGAESTSTPSTSSLPPDEAGDLETHIPEGLPKVASTAFFLIALFLLSIGVSYFFKYYVFSRDRKEWCCEKQSQSTVSPETMGLKENTSRQNTPENGNGGNNVAKTGLYANIFARSYDSDEEEIRQLELEARKAEEESDAEFRVGKKPAKATKTSILKALETANRSLRLSITKQPTTTEDSAENGKAVRHVADIWMDKVFNKSDENKNNIPGMTVVDVDSDLNMAPHANNENQSGLTSVVVHRDPSPIPSLNIHLDGAEVDANLSAERRESDAFTETPRTNTSICMLSARRKSNNDDMDGYSADFETASLYSELSNTTELQESMDNRSVIRAKSAKRKLSAHKNDVSTINDNTVNENILSQDGTSNGHAGNHIVNATSNTGNLQTALDEPCQDAGSKQLNTKAEPKPQDDVANGLWANKVTRADLTAADDGNVEKRAKNSDRSHANPTLATQSNGHPSLQGPDVVSIPEEESAAKTIDEDDKPGTPESGTPLLISDEIDTDLKHQDDVSDEPTDLATQSRRGSQPINIFSKFANNAKLPNKHVSGDAEGNDATSVKLKTPVKVDKEAEPKTQGNSPKRDTSNKARKGSAVSKPSTPRSRTNSRGPSAKKKRNAKR